VFLHAVALALTLVVATATAVPAAMLVGDSVKGAGAGLPELEELRQLSQPERTQVYDRQGRLIEVLKDEQYARYKQISLQQMGVDAFDQDEVAKKLELTDDQKSKIDEIQSDMQEQTRAAFQEAMDSGDRQGLMPKMQEIRSKAKTQALAVLTDDQKKTWEEMTGKEFNMPAGGFGGQRRRPID